MFKKWKSANTVIPYSELTGKDEGDVQPRSLIVQQLPAPVLWKDGARKAWV